MDRTAKHTAQAPVWSDATACFQRWRAGDDDALAQLVQTMTPVLWQVVRSYGLSSDQAEDVVQTTWLALVRSRAQVKQPQAVSAWLTTTARREAWRVARRQVIGVPVDDDVVELWVPHRRPVEDDVVEAEADEWLWRCVQRLSERCQHLMRIAAFEERPDYATIAVELQMPVGSIGPTRARCLAKLRALWAGDDPGD